MSRVRGPCYFYIQSLEGEAHRKTPPGAPVPSALSRGHSGGLGRYLAISVYSCGTFPKRANSINIIK